MEGPDIEPECAALLRAAERSRAPRTTRRRRRRRAAVAAAAGLSRRARAAASRRRWRRSASLARGRGIDEDDVAREVARKLLGEAAGERGRQTPDRGRGRLVRGSPFRHLLDRALPEHRPPAKTPEGTTRRSIRWRAGSRRRRPRRATGRRAHARRRARRRSPATNTCPGLRHARLDPSCPRSSPSNLGLVPPPRRRPGWPTTGRRRRHAVQYAWKLRQRTLDRLAESPARAAALRWRRSLGERAPCWKRSALPSRAPRARDIEGAAPPRDVVAALEVVGAAADVRRPRRILERARALDPGVASRALADDARRSASTRAGGRCSRSSPPPLRATIRASTGGGPARLAARAPPSTRLGAGRLSGARIRSVLPAFVIARRARVAPIAPARAHRLERRARRARRGDRARAPRAPAFVTLAAHVALRRSRTWRRSPSSPAPSPRSASASRRSPPRRHRVTSLAAWAKGRRPRPTRIAVAASTDSGALTVLASDQVEVSLPRRRDARGRRPRRSPRARRRRSRPRPAASSRWRRSARTLGLRVDLDDRDAAGGPLDPRDPARAGRSPSASRPTAMSDVHLAAARALLDAGAGASACRARRPARPRGERSPRGERVGVALARRLRDGRARGAGLVLRCARASARARGRPRRARASVGDGGRCAWLREPSPPELGVELPRRSACGVSRWGCPRRSRSSRTSAPAPRLRPPVLATGRIDASGRGPPGRARARSSQARRRRRAPRRRRPPGPTPQRVRGRGPRGRGRRVPRPGRALDPAAISLDGAIARASRPIRGAAAAIRGDPRACASRPPIARAVLLELGTRLRRAGETARATEPRGRARRSSPPAAGRRPEAAGALRARGS